MEKKQIRKPTVFEGYLTILFMIVAVGVGNGVFHYDLRVMLIISAALIMVMAYRCGFTWKQMMDSISSKIGHMSGVLLILLGIGFLSGTFIASGTVPVLVSWLGSLIPPKYVLVLSFIMTCILAEGIGSSFATMGTLGVVMFSVATSQGLPAGLAASAMICGAGFGQYLSPLAVNIGCAAESHHTTPNRIIKDLVAPTLIAFCITSVFYYFMGLRYANFSPEAAQNLQVFTAEINANFNTTPLILLPLVVAIGMAFLKVPIIIVLFGAGLLAIIMGVLLQGFSLQGCFTAGFSGFNSNLMFAGREVSEKLVALVNRGGMTSMSNSVIFLIFALVCVAVMGAMGVFDVVQKTAFKKAKHPGNLTLSASIFTLVITAVTTDVFPPIIIGAEVLRKPFMEAGFDPDRVGAVTNASANWLYNIIPWSHVAIINGGFYGVELGDWVPYSLFFFLIPVIMIIMSYLGFGNTPLPESYVDTVGAAASEH